MKRIYVHINLQIATSRVTQTGGLEYHYNIVSYGVVVLVHVVSRNQEHGQLLNDMFSFRLIGRVGATHNR